MPRIFHLWLTLAAILLVAGCGGESANNAPAPKEKDWKPLVNAKRAFADLTEFANLGGMNHLPAHREALATGRRLIRSKLEDAGFETRDIITDSWTQKIPRLNGGGLRTTTMKNILAVLPGRRPEMIAIACHYDTKMMSETFVGANDGCSGVALTLELARQLHGKSKDERAFTYLFAFLDGEEAVVDWRAKYEDVPDNCYGSRRLANQDDRFPIQTVILLDMIGDADLELVYEKSSHPDLNDLFTQTAKDVFGIDLFGGMKEIQDDHIPFKEAGMPRVIDLIDFDYGPGNSYWHKPADTVEHCSARSLERVGTLVMAALPRVEGWLEKELARK